MSDARETPEAAEASLANDVARCNGVGFHEEEGWDWREGCERCLRRTAARGKHVWMMEAPAIIAFECEFLILEDVKENPTPSAK